MGKRVIKKKKTNLICQKCGKEGTLYWDSARKEWHCVSCFYKK